MRRKLESKNLELIKMAARDRARCVTAPLTIEKEVADLRKELDRAKDESEPYAVVDGLDRARILAESITVTSSVCSIDGSPFHAQVLEIRGKFQRIVDSGEFRAWFDSRCAWANKELNNVFNCETSATNLNALATMQALKQGKVIK